MEQLNLVFDEVCQYAESIIESSSFIFEQESNLKLNIKKENPDEVFKTKTDEYLQDAIDVLKEKNKFTKYLIDNKHTDIPFFKSVWKGDMYGCRGITALIKLRDDLKNKLENTNLEKFVIYLNE